MQGQIQTDAHGYKHMQTNAGRHRRIQATTGGYRLTETYTDRQRHRGTYGYIWKKADIMQIWTISTDTIIQTETDTDRCRHTQMETRRY